MEIVNPNTSFTWSKPLDINGVPMMGNPEKQGWSFGRAGYLKVQETGDYPDRWNINYRASLRPLSTTMLERARAEYQNRQPPSFPRYFIIEPTAICNRACPFCTINITNRTGHMAWSDFYKLMEECGQHEVYGISLYQLGEPFLWRGKKSEHEPAALRDMIQVAKEIGGFQAVNVSTNGDVNNLATILGSDLDDLIISIDGTTAEVYSENRPSTKKDDPQAYERTMKRVHEFLAEKAACCADKPYVRLQIINKENTRDQVLDFIRYWIEVPGVDDVFVKNLDSMRAWLGDSVVSDEEDAYKASQIEFMPCQHLWAIGSMTVVGTTNACCHDALTELTDGSNIKNVTFQDWWQGDFMEQLRKEHTRGYFRMPCRDCRERDPWLG